MNAIRFEGSIRTAKMLVWLVCLVGALCFMNGMCNAADEKHSNEIAKAAQDGLTFFLDNFPFDQIGFSSQEEADTAIVVEGFQIYTVAPDVIQVESKNNLLELSYPTGTWRFFVKTQTRVVALITVARMDNAWKAVNIGATELASEYDKVLSAWPQTESYQARFIRVYQAKYDVVGISKAKKLLGFVPFTAEIRSKTMGIKEFDPFVLKNSKEMLVEICSSIQN